VFCPSRDLPKILRPKLCVGTITHNVACVLCLQRPRLCSFEVCTITQFRIVTSVSRQLLFHPWLPLFVLHPAHYYGMTSDDFDKLLLTAKEFPLEDCSNCPLVPLLAYLWIWNSSLARVWWNLRLGPGTISQYKFDKPKQHQSWKWSSNDNCASDYEATWLVVTILVLVIVIDNLIGIDLILWNFINFEISICAVSRTQKAAAIKAKTCKFGEKSADLIIGLIVILNDASPITSKHTQYGSTNFTIQRYSPVTW